MITCIILVILWVLCTIGFAILLGYISDLPPTPLFDMNSIGICSGCVLAMAGWVAFSVFVVWYLFG